MSDDITIRYLINNNTTEVKLFSSFFIQNTINKCKIIYNGKEYKLTEKWRLNFEDRNNQFFEIKLTGINNITNMSYMFYRCSSLISLPDISKWNTEKVTNMKCLFTGCSQLDFLPDISNWNIINVENIRSMF